MSLGSILGQTPKADIPDMTASNVSFDSSSTSPIITTDNVQSALQQAATQISGAKSTANNALNIANAANSLANLFDNYKITGYIHNYRENQYISSDTMVTRTVSWTVRPSSEPDLVIIGLCDNTYGATEFNFPDNVKNIVFTGPDVATLTQSTVLSSGAFCIGTDWNNAPTSGYYPNLSDCNFSQYYPFMVRYGDYLNEINNPTSPYQLGIYSLGGGSRISSPYGFNPGTTNNTHHIGGFNWSRSNFKYSLYFNDSATTLVGLIVFALNKIKT